MKTRSGLISWTVLSLLLCASGSALANGSSSVDCAQLLTLSQDAKELLQRQEARTRAQLASLLKKTHPPEATQNQVENKRDALIEKQNLRLQHLRKQLLILERFNAFYPVLEQLPRQIIDPNPQRKQSLKDWMLRRAFRLADILNTEAKDEKNLESLERALSQLEYDATILNDSSRHFAQTEVLRRFIQEQRFFRISDLEGLSQSILNRSLETRVAHELISLSEHFDTSIEKVLRTFRQIDDFAIWKNQGIDDNNVALLTRTAIEHRVLPETVVDMFLEIESLGSKINTDFKIPRFEVALLTHIAFEFDMGPHSMAVRFFELRFLGRTPLREDSFRNLSHAALVYLTRLSFLQRGSSPQQFMPVFFKIADLSRNSTETSAINDLGLAILTQTLLIYGNSSGGDSSDDGRADGSGGINVEGIHQINLSIAREFEKLQLTKSFTSEDYAHLTELSVAFAVRPMDLAALTKRIFKINGQSLPMLVLKPILTEAFSREANPEKRRTLTDDRLRYLTLLDFTPPAAMHDLVSETPSKKD